MYEAKTLRKKIGNYSNNPTAKEIKNGLGYYVSQVLEACIFYSCRLGEQNSTLNFISSLQTLRIVSESYLGECNELTRLEEESEKTITRYIRTGVVDAKYRDFLQKKLQIIIKHLLKKDMIACEYEYIEEFV